MKVGYVDSSCLVAVAFDEPKGRKLAARLPRFDRLLSSNLLEAELRAALSREAPNQTPEELNEGLSRILQPITWIFPDRRLTPEFRQVLAHGALKGADLWHLACALFVSPDATRIVFLTLDGPQGRVARELGFLN